LASSCAVCGAALAGSGRLAVAPSGSLGSGRPTAPELGTESCPACGDPLEREAKFCSGCGATISTGEFASPPIPEPDDVSFEEVVVTHDFVEPEIEPIPVVERRANRTGPVPVVRTPATGEPWYAWVPMAAAAFAVFALVIAMLVHVFGPSSLPNYTPAEVSLKVQMRAIEWLLAGILAAGVGVIAKR
jgi:hypothetical protein